MSAPNAKTAESVTFVARRRDIGHVLAFMLCGMAMFSFYTAWESYQEFGPRGDGQLLDGMTVFGLLLLGGAFLFWRMSPMRIPEVVIDATGITLMQTKGLPLVPRQTHAWSDIQAIIVESGKHHSTFGVELRTGAPGRGKKVRITLSSLAATKQMVVDAVRDHARDAGYTLKPGGYNVIAVSKETWTLVAK